MEHLYSIRIDELPKFVGPHAGLFGRREEHVVPVCYDLPACDAVRQQPEFGIADARPVRGRETLEVGEGRANFIRRRGSIAAGRAVCHGWEVQHVGVVRRVAVPMLYRIQQFNYLTTYLTPFSQAF